MKIKEGYVLREVAGNFIVVAVGDAALDFNGVITLNETGAVLWKTLENDATEEELTKTLMSEYEIDEATAQRDVLNFIDKLNGASLLV